MSLRSENTKSWDVCREVMARAPLRISFAGGGTDVEPYPSLYGGAVLSATINRYAHCVVRAGESDSIKVTSYDLNQTRSYSMSSVPEIDGNLDLVTAVLRRINVDRLTPMEVILHCDAPPGSGLGSSSAIVVSIIIALSRYLGVSMSRHELAHLAYLVEREDVGIAGGSQDHYASVYGGFNYMEFRDQVNVVPLRLEPYQICEIESQIVLAYVGKPRLSAKIIEKQTENLISGGSLNALHSLRDLAYSARTALLSDKYDDFAWCINEGWLRKKELTDSISSEDIENLYEMGLFFGATAGKLVGAGGGGFMLFVTPAHVQLRVAKRLESEGIAIVNSLNFGSQGALAWERRSNLARVHESFGSSHA